MKASVSLGLLALSFVSASPVPGACGTEVHERRADDKVPDYCGGAVNCETVFHNRTGMYGVAFKDNMGPGSSWFARNVADYDEFDESNSGSNEKRAANGQITSNLDRSAAKIRFGDAKPFDVLNNGVNNHCFETSCDADWTYAVHWSDGSVVDGGPPAGLLKFNAIGTYPGNKPHYAQAVGEIARRLHVSYDQGYSNCVPTQGGPPTCSNQSIRQNKSGRYFSITRFLTTNGKKAINGYVHVKVEFKTLQNGDICKDIISGLTAIMGAGGTVAGIAGGFFGILGSALCEG